jgi:serine phosphatase RsbU (regulator of sigma subunit)
MKNVPIVTATLQALDEEPSATCHMLERETTLLGKLPSCHIVLDHDTVSRRHAQIVRCRDGYFLERHFKSKNPTKLNGKKIDRPELLRDGDLIDICGFRFRFCHPTVAVRDDSDGGSTILGMLDSSASDPSTTTVRTKEKLHALIEIIHELAGTVEVKEVLEKVLATLFRIFPHADRGFVLLKNEGATQLIPSAIRNRSGDPGHLTISATVFNHVMNDGQAVLSQDALAEFGNAPSIVASQIRTLMCVPLRDRDRRTAGILQLDTRDRRGRFGAADLDLLAAVADQISVAVENARLHEVEVLERVLEQEARDARAVQLAMLPADTPPVAGYTFWHRYEPARFVGGDYYDYNPIGPGEAATRWAISLGDVMGKGMPAALLMAKLSSEFRLLVPTEADPAQLVARLNRRLCETGTADRFITFLLAVLDGARHELTVVNAGHMRPLLRRADGRIETIGDEEARAFLTLTEGETYAAVSTPIGPGDVVVLYTDGVTDAHERAGKSFKLERLMQALADAPAGADAVGEAIMGAVRQHTADCEPFDDIALLCFGRA